MHWKNGATGALLTLPLAALAFAHGHGTGYYAVLNDFWGNAFAANRWAPSASALWNGFYPPAYPTLLALLPGDRLVASAYVLNVVAGWTLLTAVFTCVAHLSTRAVAAVASLAVAAHPLVATQVLTTGADAPFVALAVVGALAVWTAASNPAPSTRLAVVGGLCLAVAAWLRYHGFVFALGALVSAVAVGGRVALRPVMIAGAVVAAAGLALAALGASAGDLASLQRAQAFNVFKGHVGSVNWYHLDLSTLPSTVGEAVARDPAAFWRSYPRYTLPHLWLALPIVVARMAPSAAVRRFAWFAGAAAVVFVPLVDLGASPRGLAPAVPLTLAALAMAADDIVRRLSTARARTAAAAIALVVAVGYAGWRWIPETRQFVEDSRAQAGVAHDLESRLRAERVAIGVQVFSDYDFYFPSARGWQVTSYHPRMVGGWPSLDLAGYQSVFPRPSTASLDAFLDDLQRLGVTHLVLTSGAGALQPDLGRLATGALTSPRVEMIPAPSGLTLFRLVG
jgi:hypothetical protein